MPRTNWSIATYGLLHVRGALTESACRLEMDSAWQGGGHGDDGNGCA